MSSQFDKFFHIRPHPHIDLSSVEKALQEKGYRVRSACGTASILDGCLRITVGPASQMEPVLNVSLEPLQAPNILES